LADIETDKATMEMEAFDSGVMGPLLIAEGGKVPIGGQVAILLKKGEKMPESGLAAASGNPAVPSSASPSATAPITSPPGGAASVSASAEGRVKASPLARKIAAAQGVSLSGIAGSGPGGRIVAKDVVGAKQSTVSGSVPVPTASVPPAPILPSQSAADQRIPLSGMRRVIAERLLASKTQIPHFYLSIEVDAAPLMKLRAEANAASEAAGGPKYTVNDFVLKAVVAAATKVSAVNASFAGDAIIQYSGVHLSVAVAVDDGLVTPVIRDAQKFSLRQISEAVKDLAVRARGKKLKPEEYQGGTITVSNLGAYGVETFSAIINPPQAAILAVGAIVKKPVVNANDQIVVGQRMSVTLSADHRVIDGAVGATYLAELRRLIEQPTLMLM
jgi:pyruvate dehydrogenase E2 component (dihydrolipoamide acetyltransferase)